MTHFIFCLALLFTSFVQAQTYVEKQASPRTNLLTNPGFESGVKTGWILSNGTLSADTTNELEGSTAASIALTAVNGNVIEQILNTAQCGKLAGQNLEVTAFVKTASANVQVCSLQGGSEVQCQDVRSDDVWGGYTFNLAGRASTACGVLVKTKASVTGTVKVDKTYLGIATNIGSVAQATPRIFAKRTSSNQTISATTATVLVWNSIASPGYDNFGEYNTTTGVMTMKSAGTVVVDFTAYIDDIAEGIAVSVRKNGTAICTEYPTMSATIKNAGVTGCSFAVTAGDTIDTTSDSAADNSYTFSILSSGFTVFMLPSASEQVTRIGTPSTPQVTEYLSGSGTYTVPTGAKYLEVEVIGGGGGGAGSGTASIGNGGAGGSTTFGSSLLTANGGGGGTGGSAGNPGGGGNGGSVTVASPAVKLFATAGGQGGNGQNNASEGTAILQGGNGASGCHGGQTRGSGNGAAESGSGGGGGGGNNTANHYTGGGGAAGGCLEAIIPGPLSATYAYSVGAAGTAGTAGTSGSPGGAGAAGRIRITAYFGTENNPLVIGSVSSNSLGMERIERAIVTLNGSTCTITSQSGSWLSSGTRNGTGDCSLSIASGTFSAAPSCSVTSYGGEAPGTLMANAKIDTASTTTLRYLLSYVQDGAFDVIATDRAASVVCMGQR